MLPITSVKQFRKFSSFTMGFFVNGNEAGYGDLMRWSGNKRVNRKWLQTESTGLHRTFKNKGHGIHLYVHLIETARSLGATRIYSSASLNDKSTRMWKEKLSLIYDVKRPTRKCECGHGEIPSKYFYIDLV